MARYSWPNNAGPYRTIDSLRYPWVNSPVVPIPHEYRDFSASGYAGPSNVTQMESARERRRDHISGPTRERWFWQRLKTFISAYLVSARDFLLIFDQIPSLTRTATQNISPIRIPHIVSCSHPIGRLSRIGHVPSLMARQFRMPVGPVSRIINVFINSVCIICSFRTDVAQSC
jgi:hypothetical protein